MVRFQWDMDGHYLDCEKKSKLQSVAERVLKEGLNVRQLEKLVQKINENVPRETKTEKKKDLFLVERESNLRDYFGTNVTIKKTKTKGKLKLSFSRKKILNEFLNY